VFLIDIPLALLAYLMTWLWIPADDKRQGDRTVKALAADIDPLGIGLFAGTVTSLLIFLLSLRHPNWIALAAAVILLAGLVGWELRATAPLVDMRLLISNHGLTRTYVRQLCTQVVMYSPRVRQPTVSRPLSSQILFMSAPATLTAAIASGSLSEPWAVTAAA
jgi:hypothetical protein